MKNVVATTGAAVLLGAVTLGVAGVANAAPLNDPLGLCGNVNLSGNCVWGTGHPRSNVNIEFPANSPLEQGIVDFATKSANDYYAVEADARANPSPQPSELDVTATSYTSGTPQTGTQTVVAKAYQSMSGAAHPMTWYRAFPFNNATQAPITFDTLFTPGAKPIDVILPLVNQQISAASGEPFTADPQAGLDPASYQNFAVTDDAVIFFFDKNELRAATGDFQVSVPRSAVAPMLSPGI